MFNVRRKQLAVCNSVCHLWQLILPTHFSQLVSGSVRQAT